MSGRSSSDLSFIFFALVQSLWFGLGQRNLTSASGGGTRGSRSMKEHSSKKLSCWCSEQQSLNPKAYTLNPVVSLVAFSFSFEGYWQPRTQLHIPSQNTNPAS